MTRMDKRLQKMRQNPRDWRIEDIRSVADSLGIEWLHDGGSHVIFRSPHGEHLSIPPTGPSSLFTSQNFWLWLKA